MTPDGPPPTFTLFPNLPTELQTKIWKCALPGPRVIQVHYLNSSFSFNGARPPPVLHTCRTSREVALSVFEPAFTRNNKLAPIYINLVHDTLHLATKPGIFAHTAGSFPDSKKIQSLAVEISLDEDLETVLVDIKRSSPSNLREIILVVGHEEPLVEFKSAEYVRFSEPEARSRLPWQTWKGWTEHFLKGCIV